MERRAERDVKYRVKKLKAQENGYNSSETMQEDSSSDSESSSKIDKEKKKKKVKFSKLITDLDEYEEDEGKIKMPGGLSKKATLFFENPVFEGILKSDLKNDNQENSRELSANKITDNDSNSEETKTIDESITTEVKGNHSGKENNISKPNGSLKRKIDKVSSSFFPPSNITIDFFLLRCHIS